MLVEIPAAAEWATVSVPTRSRVRLSAADGKPVRWLLIDDADAALFEGVDGAEFWTATPGVYRAIMYSPEKGFVRVYLVAGKPNPKPGPDDPIPPPKPVPVDDPVVAKIKKAYADSTEADKDATRKDLISLYTLMQKAIKDGQFATVDALADRLGQASDLMVGKGKLRPVRDVIQAELAAAIPESADLTEANQTQLADLFSKFVTALQP